MFLFSCFTFFRWPASCERFSAVLNGIAVLLHKFHYYCLCCWCASARARMCEWVSIRGIRVSRKVSERSFTGVWLAECVSVGDWIVFVKFPIHSKSTLFVRFDFFFFAIRFHFFHCMRFTCVLVLLPPLLFNDDELMNFQMKLYTNIEKKNMHRL